MRKLTKKDLTIVEITSFKHSIFVGEKPTKEITRYVFYYPQKEELHGKTISKSCLFGGINVEDVRLRQILPMVDGAELVSSNMRQDYKDDPYGRLVPCGMVNVQTWDISKVIS